jgi:bifunctional enzyme CysN/CysC
MNEQQREQMNVVIVGHVDHGKSTLVGRLLADTDSLPQGKLEAVKANCARTARPFEYAFLLDALKDEQAQGITIDTARSFFKSKKRDYIIIDAPGHIEFLKNMISGAARAEAALLVIDAKEGIRENSKRHGYMMSFLGIKNVAVCVNKMDLVNYSEETFNQIKEEYTKFLNEIHLKPKHFIPIAAREGDNMVSLSKNMPWYKGVHILDCLDGFEKAAPNYAKELRMPVQDIYKFTEEEDDRRIFAGRIDSGTLRVGEEVVFLPSQKRSKIATIEGFNLPKQTESFAGQSTGVTLETQIYVRRGEIMCKTSERQPHVSNKFKANIFWMGKQPLVKNKNYKLKLASQQVPVILSEIVSVLDASELSSISNKPQVDRHDVAECILEALKPVAFDEINNVSETGRFVIVDNYEICGGGIILAPVFEGDTALNQHIKSRDFKWERSDITPSKRSQKFEHKSLLVVISGQADTGKLNIAKALEKKLFEEGKVAYFLGISNDLLAGASNSNDRTLAKAQHIQHLGELAHIMTDAGQILITSISDIDDYDLQILKNLNRPNKTLSVSVGEGQLAANQVDVQLVSNENPSTAVEKIMATIRPLITPDPEYTI